jgi:hypothetical protein
VTNGAGMSSLDGQLSLDDAAVVERVVELVDPVVRTVGDHDVERAEPADGAAPLRVEVIRSARRKTTVAARVDNDVLSITIPSWMNTADEQHWVGYFTERVERQRSSDAVDLGGRAVSLAKRFGFPNASDIRFVDNMGSRWGSCTVSTGEIRISRTLLRGPTWVLDYVIVHELAHLLHADHSPEFWAAVHRYPRSERAIGFLQGWSLRGDDGDDEPPLPEDVGVERPIRAPRRTAPETGSNRSTTGGTRRRRGRRR